ncbi:MAG: hypothetical protein RLZZ08_1960 [Pseudomonadota bacterium]
MSIFDGILKNIAGSPDDVANLAAKIGIDPAMAEKAIAALGQAHQAPGDTVELAAAKTGLPTDKLSSIVEQLGGEGSLAGFASMLKDNPMAAGIMSKLDADGDGNPINDVMGMAGKLFGKD